MFCGLNLYRYVAKIKFPHCGNYIYLPICLFYPISPILPTVELPPERPEGRRRWAKLHLGKI